MLPPAQNPQSVDVRRTATSVNQLVAGLARAYTLSEIFPLHHPTVRDALDELVHLPADVYPATVVVSQFGLTQESREVADPHGHVRELARSLHGAGVSSLRVPRGLTHLEAEDFLLSLRRVAESDGLSLEAMLAEGRGTPIELSFHGGALQPVLPAVPAGESDSAAPEAPRVPVAPGPSGTLDELDPPVDLTFGRAPVPLDVQAEADAPGTGDRQASEEVEAEPWPDPQSEMEAPEALEPEPWPEPPAEMEAPEVAEAEPWPDPQAEMEAPEVAEAEPWPDPQSEMEAPEELEPEPWPEPETDPVPEAPPTDAAAAPVDAAELAPWADETPVGPAAPAEEPSAALNRPDAAPDARDAATSEPGDRAAAEHAQVRAFREALRQGLATPAFTVDAGTPVEQVLHQHLGPVEPEPEPTHEPEREPEREPDASTPLATATDAPAPVQDLAPEPVVESVPIESLAPDQEALAGRDVQQPPDDAEQIVDDAALFVAASEAQRPAIQESILEAAARLGGTGRPDAIAKAVTALVRGSGIEADAPAKLARLLLEPDVVASLVQGLAEARTTEERDGIIYTFVRLSDVLAPSLARALSEVPARSARRNYMDALSSMGRDAVNAAIPMLEDSRWFIVRNGVDILGETGFYDSIGKLTQTLSHPDARVRRATVMAMAKIGGEEAGLQLLPTLDDPSQEVKEAGTMALGHLRVMKALRPLLAILEREKDEEFQLLLLRSLGQLQDPGAVPVIEKRALGGFFTKPSKSVRIAGYRALAAIGTPHARQLVIAAIEDRDPEVAAVARALASQLD